MKRGRKPYGAAKQVEVFWSKVMKTEGCWLWQGRKERSGYGCARYSGWPCLAHRLSWLLAFGGIPEGMLVLHRCDDPACVRPDHLFLGTRADNMRDMVDKGRDPRGEFAHAAKLTWGKVEEMKAIRRRRGLSYRKIGVLYGVSENTARRAIIGRAWRPYPNGTRPTFPEPVRR